MNCLDLKDEHSCEFYYKNIIRCQILIDKYNGISKQINIPEKNSGQEIVVIGEKAFPNNLIIQHIYLYLEVIEERYIYNRCHLIGHQLSRENAKEKNLITGTRYLNVEGMLPYENEVASYVRRTGNHVMYRVT